MGCLLGTGWLCLQKGLQHGPDAGCAVSGHRGAHLLSEHTPGSHPALPAHSWTPPYMLDSTAPTPQPQAARGGILGKNRGSSPHHFILPYQTILDSLGLSSPWGPRGRTLGCRREGCPHPSSSSLCAEGGMGEKEEGGNQRLTHSSSTIRRSPQTLSTLKTWISLATPPKTDTRPSCQVRSTVGLRGTVSPGDEELKMARYIP